MIIKATIGLRVSEEEEIVGLDSCEHGLASAYAGFSIMDISNTMTMDVNENTDLGVSEYDAASETQKDAAVILHLSHKIFLLIPHSAEQ